MGDGAAGGVDVLGGDEVGFGSISAAGAMASVCPVTRKSAR